MLQYTKTIYENINVLCVICNNWPNDLLGTNIYNTLELFWELLLKILQCTNTTSVISKRGTFLPFSSLVILLLVLLSNLIISVHKSSLNHLVLIPNVLLFPILFTYSLIEELWAYSPCSAFSPSLFYVIQNMIRFVIQIYHSTLELTI